MQAIFLISVIYFVGPFKSWPNIMVHFVVVILVYKSTNITYIIMSIWNNINILLCRCSELHSVIIKQPFFFTCHKWIHLNLHRYALITVENSAMLPGSGDKVASMNFHCFFILKSNISYWSWRTNLCVVISCCSFV